MRNNNDEAFTLSVGWQPRENLINDALSNASLLGTAILRPGGLTEISVMAVTSAHGGGGNTQTLFVEGSNDGGVNWHTVYSTPAGETISAVGTLLINSTTNVGVIKVDRWEWIRTRLTSTGSTFVTQVSVSGFSKPADAQISNNTLVRAGATQNGVPFGRQGGSRYATVQAVCSALVLGAAATAVNVNLQGSMDGTSWVNIGDVLSFTTTNSQQMQQKGNLIDLGGFNRFRFQGVDVTGGAAVTSYTIRAYLSTDSSDWLVDDGSTLADQTFNTAFGKLSLVSLGAEAANKRILTMQLLQFDGSPMLAARKVSLILGDTIAVGEYDLATNATINGTAVTGTVQAGGASNSALVLTSVAGLLAVTIDDTSVETIYASGGTSKIVPRAASFQIVQSDEVAAAFA